MSRFDPTARIEFEHEPTFENEWVELAWSSAKVVFALAPLIGIALIFWNAFDDEEEEKRRREQKCTNKCC